MESSLLATSDAADDTFQHTFKVVACKRVCHEQTPAHPYMTDAVMYPAMLKQEEDDFLRSDERLDRSKKNR